MQAAAKLADRDPPPERARPTKQPSASAGHASRPPGAERVVAAVRPRSSGADRSLGVFGAEGGVARANVAARVALGFRASTATPGELSRRFVWVRFPHPADKISSRARPGASLWR